MGTKPTHEQAQLHRQVHDLRREARLRQARDWFQQNYIVETIDDALRIAALIRGETTRLRNAVDSQLDVSEVVLDLARVSTIDASGLGAMLELREPTQSRGIGFKLMNVSKLVSKVLEITRLTSVLDVVSEAEVRFSFPGRMAQASLAACA